MRAMEIRGFRKKIQIADLEPFIKGRLIGDLVLWPDQALPLVGYMAWPNHANVRDQWLDAHRSDSQSDGIRSYANSRIFNNIGRGLQISSIIITTSLKGSTSSGGVGQV